MPSLSVRKLDDETILNLRIQAARHGVSMEEEVRQIIKQAVSRPEKLGDFALSLFSETYDNKDFTLPQRETSPPLKH